MSLQTKEFLSNLDEKTHQDFTGNIGFLTELLPNLEAPVNAMNEKLKSCSRCHRKTIIAHLIQFLASIKWTEESREKLKARFGEDVMNRVSAQTWPRVLTEEQAAGIPAAQLPVLGMYARPARAAVKSADTGDFSFPRPACPQCVLKHLADAGILMIEAQHGYPVHRAWAIGNLSQAEQECFAMDPEFAAEIREKRLKIMTEQEYVPDFNPLLSRALELAGLAAREAKVTVLTVTRDRQALFALHEKMLNNQTFQNFQWVVVDDGKEPVGPARACKYIRREHDPKKRFTHRENLLAGLKEWNGGIIIFMEDDDFYPPEYLAETVKLARSSTGLFGWKNATYYWPLEKHRLVNQREDLCITALSGCHFRHRDRFIDIVRSCEGNFVDIDLWHKFADKTMRKYPGETIPIGIKGLSRNGFTGEHRKKFEKSEHEHEPWFRSQVGEELFAKYQQIMSGAKNTPANKKG